MRSAIIAMGCLVATPMLAEGEAFLGLRCSPNEMMVIEADSVGFNESTVCNYFTQPFYGNGTMEMTLKCATVIVTDYETDPVTTIRMDERKIDLLLNRVNEIDLDVYIDGELTGRFGACG
ncbi:hypothetical protein [Yoonia sp. 208BN28-4]|uniref:hypothetical protein n=1 Tax=Yoonia sp. 208BN28-4 TaxID=3126505 RepID=UPI0030AC105F